MTHMRFNLYRAAQQLDAGRATWACRPVLCTPHPYSTPSMPVWLHAQCPAYKSGRHVVKAHSEQGQLQNQRNAARPNTVISAGKAAIRCGLLSMELCEHPSKEGVVYAQLHGNKVQLQRVIKPAQPNMTTPCCSYTQLTVQEVRDAEGHQAYQVLGVQMCGRSKKGTTQRCKHHQGTPNYEVWVVRMLGGPPAPQPQQQSKRSGVTAQAAQLFGCDTEGQLARFFKLPGSHRLVFQDHWGAYGVSYEDLVAAVGRVREAPPADQQTDLPLWKRAQMGDQARRHNATVTGLQVHALEEPSAKLPRPQQH